MYYRLAVFVLLLFLTPPEGAAQELNAETISRIMGVTATTSADGVARVGWPRTDVEFHVDGRRSIPRASSPSVRASTWTLRMAAKGSELWTRHAARMPLMACEKVRGEPDL